MSCMRGMSLLRIAGFLVALIAGAAGRDLQQTLTPTQVVFAPATIVVDAPLPSPTPLQLCPGGVCPPTFNANDIILSTPSPPGIKIADIQVAILGEYDTAKVYGQSKMWLAVQPTTGSSNSGDQRDLLKGGVKAAAAIEGANWAYTSKTKLAAAQRPQITGDLVAVRGDALSAAAGAVFQFLDLAVETALTVGGDLQPDFCNPGEWTPATGGRRPCTTFRGATLAKLFYTDASTNKISVNANNAPITVEFGAKGKPATEKSTWNATFNAVNLDLRNGGFNPSRNLVFGGETHVEAMVGVKVNVVSYSNGGSPRRPPASEQVITFRAGWWTDSSCPKKDGLDTACKFWAEGLTNVEFVVGFDRYMLGVARGGANIPVSSSLTFPLQLTLVHCSNGDRVHVPCFEKPPPPRTSTPSPQPSSVPSSAICVPGQPKPAGYVWDETKNAGGAYKCSNQNSCMCSGTRVCSRFGWCG